MIMSLLEATGLTHSFGENYLFKNADFTLNKGEHIGIVGQNGAGKSTFIKICTEQLIPDSGRIVWQPNTKIGYLDQYAQIEKSVAMSNIQNYRKQSSQPDADAKRIRLDIYVKDNKNIVYNIEMQASDTKELPKRSKTESGMEA